MKDLIEILTWCRGAGTKSEQDFVRQHIASIENIWPDEYGNYHLTIGAEPQVLWSCHTDTVTRKEGRQNVKWVQNGLLGLNNPKPGQCLGADDGGGLWIMLELIKEGVKGHYVFHRDEEVGGLGSRWIAANAYVLPDTIQTAIAMDRAGTRDIITHQMYERCCSDVFAASLALQLPEGMRGDDSGIFTDTANYTGLIGECTNLSIGYEHNHGPNETLDTNHLRRLRDALLQLDPSQLDYERKPGEVEYGGYGGYYGGVNSWYPTHTHTPSNDDVPWEDENDYRPLTKTYHSRDEELMSYQDMVSCAPDVASRLLDELGVTREEFRAHVFALKGHVLGA